MYARLEFVYMFQPKSFRRYWLVKDRDNTPPRQQKSVVGQNYPIEWYCDRHYGNLFVDRQAEGAILESGKSWRIA